MDKRERIAKHLKYEAKTKEELSKLQPELLLEQYVSSCVKKMVTTASPVQEEVKAQDVVSDLKNVPKGYRKNSQACNSKNVTTPGAAQVKGKGLQQTKKGNGKGKDKPKNEIERQGTRHSREQEPDEEFWQRKEEHIQGSRLWKRKKQKKEGKTGGESKGQKISTTR